jgi:8-oxo-dGTP pyrophosphatase MutT (NUDIX family)
MHDDLQHTIQRLASVRLNPRRHTAPSALAHSEAAAARAGALARANGLHADQVRLLETLGLVHDIGKVTGTARPERSVEVLAQLGVDDPVLLGLVRWHDTALPWYRSTLRGQGPTDKAWRRLAAEVDLRLLALFMVADRVDAPPGWRRNPPTIWFLDQARRRGLLGDLILDLPDTPSEVSAGGALVDGAGVLLIRVRPDVYELPKGGIEWDELPEEAAARETREEAGVADPLRVGRELGEVTYPVGEGAERHLKRVRFFALTSPGARLGPLPPRTRERRWVDAREAVEIALISADLRPILLEALA